MLLKDILKQRSATGVIWAGGLISYKVIYGYAQEIAYKLNAKNTSERVGIIIDDTINYFYAYFGIAFSQSHIIVPINHRNTNLEIIKEIKNCDINCLLTDSKNFLRVKESAMLSGIYVRIINVETLEDVAVNEDQLEKTFNLFPLLGIEGDACIFLQTSGSTSYSKKVIHTNASILQNAKLHIKRIGLQSGDRAALSIPMAFSYCNTAVIVANVLLENDILISNVSGFDPQSFWEDVLEYKVTYGVLVPTQLISMDASMRESLYVSQDVKICYGGSFLHRKYVDSLAKKFPNVTFINTYGQTEAGPRITANYPNGKSDSAGRPLDGICLKVVDKENREVATNTVGRIFVKTPCAMRGYHKNPDLTLQTIVNGWIDTGDLGYVDKEGYLYITGRSKNIIISGGINVFPEEIEEVLLSYDGVKAVRVYSQDNLLLGEVPLAELVWEGKESFDEEKLKSFCKERLSMYKIPVRFLCVDKIKTTYSGKIVRHYG